MGNESLDSSSGLRARLDSLKLFSLMAIAFYHAPEYCVDTLAYKYFSLNLTSFRLPLIFLLSGYFLLRKDLLSWASYLLEVRKRLKSLVIPYFFWNILMLASVAVVLFAFPNALSGKGYSLGGNSPQNYIDAIFGIGREPIHYQFWFLKNLFALVLLSPFLKFFLEKYTAIGIVVFFVIGVEFSGVGYFYLGGVFWKLGFHRFFMMEKSIVVLLMTLGLAAVSMILNAPNYVVQFNSLLFLMSFSTVASDLIPGVISRMAKYSFVVFAAHEPIVTFIGKILGRMRGTVPDAVLYLVSGLVTVVSCLIFGVIFRRLLPKLYSVAVGDR